MVGEAVDRLYRTGNASDAELKLLIGLEDPSLLREAAVSRRLEWYGRKVFIRGLIEFTNHCRNNCYYCGIRAGNVSLGRYRLAPETIMELVREGYRLGFRTFVLQGGEDNGYSDEGICSIVSSVKKEYPDCAVTLSIGEKDHGSYRAYFDAGADRYLLRHETASQEHYSSLHPSKMSLENRKACLWDLKRIGYQVGSGFMVGSPGQSPDNLVEDLRFLQELQPDMIGIGPFVPAANTPFATKKAGSVATTLNLISILRLMFPYSLIPSTTSLGTIAPGGLEKGLEAGANVIMPDLTPPDEARLYSLYDNKPVSGGALMIADGSLRERIRAIGYDIVTDRGDVAGPKRP